MENPATWTRATNLIAIAIQDHADLCSQGYIGGSLARYIEDSLTLAGYLTPAATKVTGLQVRASGQLQKS